MNRLLSDVSPVQLYVVGPLEVNLDAHLVTVHGVPIPMSRMELRLLADLVRHQGQIRTREELLTQVWGYRPGVHTRTAVIHIARLRAKLGEAADLIETVYGVGYRLSPRSPVTQSR